MWDLLCPKPGVDIHMEEVFGAAQTVVPCSMDTACELMGNLSHVPDQEVPNNVVKCWENNNDSNLASPPITFLRVLEPRSR